MTIFMPIFMPFFVILVVCVLYKSLINFYYEKEYFFDSLAFDCDLRLIVRMQYPEQYHNQHSCSKTNPAALYIEVQKLFHHAVSAISTICGLSIIIRFHKM